MLKGIEGMKKLMLNLLNPNANSDL